MKDLNKRWFSQLHFWVCCLVFVLGSGLTYLMQANERLSQHRVLETEFDFRVNQIIANVQARLSLEEQVLEGVRSLFLLTGGVDRQNFAEYLRHQQSIAGFSGRVAIGFSANLRAADVARHVAAVHAEGYADYKIWPPARRASYAPRLYLEPFSQHNRRAFGYDLSSDPVRWQAMEASANNDQAILSGHTQLVQESAGDGGGGVLLFLPVYRPGMAHGTMA
ncbi:CHASE domain-containing protein, partial [Duganella sp. FT3S]